MSKYSFSTDLSKSGIDKMTSQIIQYKQDLERKVSLLMEQIVKLGAETAKAKVSSMNAIYTGSLISSIQGIYDASSHIGVIYTDCPYAVYVEYGTGVVGSQNPHPYPPSGWKYDMNGHGESGWFYWKDDNWHWTKGIASRPFMFETQRELPKIMAEAMKAVFG